MNYHDISKMEAVWSTQAWIHYTGGLIHACWVDVRKSSWLFSVEPQAFTRGWLIGFSTHHFVASKNFDLSFTNCHLIWRYLECWYVLITFDNSLTYLNWHKRRIITQADRFGPLCSKSRSIHRGPLASLTDFIRFPGKSQTMRVGHSAAFSTIFGRKNSVVFYEETNLLTPTGP